MLAAATTPTDRRPFGRRRGRHAGRWLPRGPRLAWLLLWTLCGPLVACRDGARSGTSQGSAPGAPGHLRVEVEPAEGISVLLDGVRVTDRSPYVHEALASGSHVLEVRGMGRYPVALPFTLAPGAKLDIPVVLRSRPPLPFTDAAIPSAPPDPMAAPPGAGAATAPRVRPSLGNRANAPLPPGATPLRLAVAPTPPATILADGTEMAGTDVRLSYGQGLLQVGEMRLAYRVFPGRSLELTVPHEQGPWFLGEQQIKAKSLVRVSATPLVLRRGVPPTQQQVWLRRLE